MTLSPLLTQFLALDLQGRYKFLSTCSEADSHALHVECAAAGKIDDYYQAGHVLAVMHDSVADKTHPYWTQKQNYLEMFNPTPPTPPSIHPFRIMNEWQRYVYICSLDEKQLHALRMALVAEHADLAYGNAVALKDHMSPDIQKGHPLWKRKLAWIAHIESTYWIEPEWILAVQEKA